MYDSCFRKEKAARDVYRGAQNGLVRATNGSQRACFLEVLIMGIFEFLNDFNHV